MSIYVNSRDKPARFNADNARYAVDVRADGISRVGLSSYDFITQFDNINDISGTSYIATASQTVPITIPNKMYGYSALATAITAACLSFPGGAITCIWDGVRFHMVSVVPIKFIYNPEIVGAKSWSMMIGMEHLEQLPLGAGLAAAWDGGLADIQYTNALFITSSALHRSKIKEDFATNRSIANVLGVVYLYGGLTMETIIDVPAHATAELSVVKYVNWNPQDVITNFDIIILDERGLELPALLHDQMTFMLEIRMM